MSDVLDGVEIPVVGGDFDTAAPAVSTAEEPAVGVRNFCSVDLDSIIVKTLVQRTRIANSRAIFVLRELTAISESHADTLGLRRDDSEFDTAL